MDLEMKKTIIFVAKYSISIGILVILFQKIEFNSLLHAFQKISLSTLFFVLFIAVVKLWTQYRNWKVTLHLDSEVNLSKVEIFRSYFIGLALRFALPGGAATFGKAYFLEHDKKSVLASVGVEKIIQNWGNLIFGVWISLFWYPLQNRFLHLALVLLATLFPFIFILFFRFVKKERHQKFLQNYQKKIVYLLGMQMFFISLTATQYYLILKDFRIVTYVKAFFSSVLILMSNTIPISIQGAGLRESFAVFFLGKIGFLKEEAIASALIIFFVNGVLPALLGLYFILKKKR
jgi:uncharacterized membrane protein YbhN (UPF0104 family)